MSKKTNETKIIAITYEKGGVAKTTTAVNVSAMLAERGYKVLLVDLDHQSYATSYYDMYDDQLPGIYQVMQGSASAEQVIRKTEFFDLDILPATTALRNIETLLMMKTRGQEYTLKNALANVSLDYDFILIDCPPSGDRIKTNALTIADYVLLPTIPDDYAIHGLLCMSEELLDVKKYCNPALSVIGVLVTIDEKTSNKMAYKSALQQQDMFPVFATVIRKNTKLSEAINAHKPINVYDKRCSGYHDYESLTDEIIQKSGRASDFEMEV